MADICSLLDHVGLDRVVVTNIFTYESIMEEYSIILKSYEDGKKEFTEALGNYIKGPVFKGLLSLDGLDLFGEDGTLKLEFNERRVEDRIKVTINHKKFYISIVSPREYIVNEDDKDFDVFSYGPAPDQRHPDNKLNMFLIKLDLDIMRNNALHTAVINLLKAAKNVINNAFLKPTGGRRSNRKSRKSRRSNRKSRKSRRSNRSQRRQ